VPENGKMAKDAKESVQECVSEFISFITSEWVEYTVSPNPTGLRPVQLPCARQPCILFCACGGSCRASDKCMKEKRKTINGDDLIWSLGTLGFEEYVDPLKLYLKLYREVFNSIPLSSKSPNFFTGVVCVSAPILRLVSSLALGLSIRHKPTTAPHNVRHYHIPVSYVLIRSHISITRYTD
jgi:histone H3/H4